MILFGHLGLTYAITAGIDNASLRNKLLKFNQAIDYRPVFIGAILPDLIDKLIIFFISSDTIHSGRIYAHSALFVVLLTFIGILIWNKSKKPWILILAGCSAIHLMLDRMWMYMSTLLWPVYDLFTSHIAVYPQSLIHAIMSILAQNFESVSMTSLKDALADPYIGIPEIIGLLIMIYFVIKLISSKQVGRFFKTGGLEK